MHHHIRPKRSQTILSCVLAALLIPAFLVCSLIINTEMKQHTQETLSEISALNVKSMQFKVRDDFQLLEQISNRVSYDNEESVHAGIKNAAEAYGYKRLEIVYPTGEMFASDDLHHDICHEDHVQLAFTGTSNLSDVHADSGDNEPIVAYSVPIYDKANETVIAALVAVMDTGSYRAHLSVSAFDGKEYAYIVRTNGDTVLDSDHPKSYPEMGNIFSAMMQVGKNEPVVETLRSDMAHKLKGCLMFENAGDKRYINYEPLDINDWYIISVVPTDVTDAARFKILIIITLVFLLVALVAIVFVATLIRSEKTKKAELEHIIYTDALTGGMSFTKFCMEATKLLHHRDNNLKIACVMADIDNFRLINSLYGKEEGDRTILRTYHTLQKVLSPGELVARASADRFYALIQFQEQTALEEKLHQFISALKTNDGTGVTQYILRPAIGVYVVDNGEESIETITNNATIAHDTIGIHGERIAYYDDAQRDRMQQNKLLEDRMELAQRNHEFIPYFQPKYDARTGKICGAEALARWRHADGSLTSPGTFIPLAERNGFIRVLDREIFKAVCAFQRDILDSGGKCVPISVNVSRQLMYEQNFASDYIEALKEYQLSPDLIELEITESVLFDDQTIFRSIINQLRDYGFKILMDDFGTGYSSLMMLGTVPIDNLKLDKSLIDGVAEEKGRKIIISVIELAKSLHLPLTAEGVETHGQFDFLKKLGCNVIQGYYFSKPISDVEFREMLKKENNPSA